MVTLKYFVKDVFLYTNWNKCTVFLFTNNRVKVSENDIIYFYFDGRKYKVKFYGISYDELKVLVDVFFEKELSVEEKKEIERNLNKCELQIVSY